MFRNVLIPVDGSPLAEQALLAALAVCRRASARLHLVHVRSHHAGEAFLLAEDPGRAYLEDLATRVGADLGTPVSSAILPEEAPTLLRAAPSPDTIAALLARYASGHDVDLIVLTSHGRSGLSRLWFGSVAEALLRRSQAPLLLIRPEKEDTAQNRWNDREPLHRILVATDGSEASHRAVRLASTFGTMFGAAFELFRVVPAPYEVLGALAAVTVAYTGQDVEESIARARKALEDEAETLRAAGSTVTTEVVIDPSPARAILRHARDRGPDLVVLATRARDGLDRLLIGSVADKVIRGGEVPLLVLPPDPETIAEANDALIASAEAAVRDE